MKKKAGYLASERLCQMVVPRETHHPCRRSLPRRQCIRENHLMVKLFLQSPKTARDGQKMTTHHAIRPKARD
jgi:hypothetical protein